MCNENAFWLGRRTAKADEDKHGSGAKSTNGLGAIYTWSG